MGERVAFVWFGGHGVSLGGVATVGRARGDGVRPHRRPGEGLERGVSGEEDRRDAERSAADADLVFTCVGDDPDVRAVVLEPGGVLSAMRPATSGGWLSGGAVHCLAYPGVSRGHRCRSASTARPNVPVNPRLRAMVHSLEVWE